MRRRGARRRAASLPLSLSAGVLALVVISGCTSDAEPTTTVHDEVTWANGVKPSGPHEDDPRVVAVRRYDTLLKASNNELNFTDPRLAEVATPDEIDIRVKTARRVIESSMFPLWVGPQVMGVSDIRVHDDEATVYMCTRMPTWWRWDDDAAAVKEITRDDSRPFEYDTYELVQVDGRWLVDKWRPGVGPDDSQCDPGPDVAVGTFTTPPDLDLLGTLTPADVIAPSRAEQ